MANRGLRVSTRVEGLNSVIHALVALGVDLDDLKGAMAEIARFGAVEASRHAPKRSGRLSRDVRGNRAKGKAVITAGRVSVPYAGVQNFGWAARNITATGFMQKADRAVQPYALRRLEADINRAIARRGLR